MFAPSSVRPSHPHSLFVFSLLSDVSQLGLPSSHSQMFRCIPACAFPLPLIEPLLPFPVRPSLCLFSFLTWVLIEVCSVSPVGLFKIPYNKRGNVWAVCVMYVWHSLMSASPLYGVDHSSARSTSCAVIEWAERGEKSRLGEMAIRKITGWLQATALTLSPRPPAPDPTSKCLKPP